MAEVGGLMKVPRGSGDRRARTFTAYLTTGAQSRCSNGIWISDKVPRRDRQRCDLVAAGTIQLQYSSRSMLWWTRGRHEGGRLRPGSQRASDVSAMIALCPIGPSRLMTRGDRLGLAVAPSWSSCGRSCRDRSSKRDVSSSRASVESLSEAQFLR